MKTHGGFLSSRIKRIGDRIFEQMLSDSGVHAFNGAQGKILYVLWEHGEVSISTIAQNTSLSKTSLTSMLDRMERGGLILRRQNPRSRREILVSITEEARQLQAAYEAVSQRINQVYYRGFRPEEIEQYEAYLARILANLEECEKAHRRNES